MATYSITYNEVWKWFNMKDSTVANVFWEDFNFNMDWMNVVDDDPYADCVYNKTTNFDLSWFCVWHEAVAFDGTIKRDWPAPSYDQYYRMEFLRSTDWVYWSTWWRDRSWLSRGSLEEGQYSWWWTMYYVWVDDDEIRPTYSYYKFYFYSEDWEWDFYSPTFTVSNLSFDTSLHKSWYLRVEGNHLCYTDGSWWELWNYWYWYKHKIAYDGWYSSYVWTDNSGMIRLETDVVRRIYYVDQYWYKRRTYPASNRYNYPSWQWYKPSNSVYWKIWSPWDWDAAEYWYWHLCFVNQTWYLMRILNWPPGWVE